MVVGEREMSVKIVTGKIVICVYDVVIAKKFKTETAFSADVNDHRFM